MKIVESLKLYRYLINFGALKSYSRLFMASKL